MKSKTLPKTLACNRQRGRCEKTNQRSGPILAASIPEFFCQGKRKQSLISGYEKANTVPISISVLGYSKGSHKGCRVVAQSIFN